MGIANWRLCFLLPALVVSRRLGHHLLRVISLGTPLWRNGPPEKPVLCNACGSRWRTKGSLTNYVPLHAREAFDSDELKVPKIKNISFKPKEHKWQKKKQSNNILESECEIQYCDQNFHKIAEGDTSNRSSSGSAISGSDSCVQFGTTDASDVTGSVQSNVWDSLVPSKRRTFVTRPKPSPVEKLTKDLCSILHEEQASNLSITSEDDLLYESLTPFDSSEIGYGGVLIKHPNSKSVEEESEASSLPVDKSYLRNEGYTGSSFPVNIEGKGTSFLNSGTGTMKSTTQLAQENVKRGKISHEKLKILRDRDSPLTSADLNIIVKYDVFMKYLTYEERQQLMKYLPSIDTVKPPESLKNMFSSPQFLETLSYFQQLLQEGVFDLSLSGANAEECKNLKRLVLLNCSNLQWLECYQKIKDAPSKKTRGGNGTSPRRKLTGLSNFSSLKRHHDKQNRDYPELSTMRSSKKVCKSGRMSPPRSSTQLESSIVSKVTDDTVDIADHEGGCSSPRRVLASPDDRSSMLAAVQFIADSPECDWLLDVPSGASFAEAELLYHPWKQKSNRNGSSTESGVEASDHPSSSFTNK
ncbi:GATA transcription factor 26-like isoform X2 [Musa acuminata AAA Group]|uniref:GATA transcription factor 26-like isoform X2 n=1 Tax=Musa acuminata AAA Group TaxID=214697 RepID=UPI0031E0DC5C